MIFLILLFPMLALIGQIPERISEEQLGSEAVFLDALQMKLLDKYDEALKAFTEIEKTDPTNDVVLFEIATIYEAANNFPNAINYVEKAIAIQPKNMVYRQFAMDLYRMSNDIPKYNLELEYQIANGKYNEDHFYQLVKNHNRMGDYKESVKVLERLEKMAGYTKKLGLTRTKIFQRENDQKKLGKELEKLEKNFGNDVEVLQQIATVHQANNDMKEALECYQKILKIDPHHAGAQIFIASQSSQSRSEIQYLRSFGSLMESENLSKDDKIKQLIPFIPKGAEDPEIFSVLLDYAEILQKMYPGDPKVNAMHGDIYYNARQPGFSVKYYKQSLVYIKSVFEVWQQLMQALDLTGQYRELEKIVMEALELYPNQAVCYYFAGKTKLITGQPAASLEFLEEGVKIPVNNAQIRSDMKLMMVDAYIQLHKKDPAQKLFSELNSDPEIRKDHPYFLEIYGHILNLQGRKNEAIDKWQQAIQSGANKERIQKLIDGLK